MARAQSLVVALATVSLTAASVPAGPPPCNVSYLSADRFPMEGKNTVVLCTDPPLPAPTAAAPATASIHEVGVSLRFPTRGHGFTIDPPAGNGTPGCFTVPTSVTANVGPGMLVVASGGAASVAQPVTYYESVAITFGLRPYINESFATLLLAPAPEVIAASAAPGATAATVLLHLPFAAPPRTESWKTAPNGGLLTQPEQVLTFPLTNLPSTINQDVKIEITLPSGKTITKWRRLMRAPPLPARSSITPVQVDHTTKSLLVVRYWPKPGRNRAKSTYYWSTLTWYWR